MSAEPVSKNPSGSISELPASRIDAKRPAGDQIYRLLQRAILDMSLPPSSAVSEAEVGARLGASRTPVREALIRLREAGLIDTFPSRGNFVSKLSATRILEAQFLREGLELANIRYLATGGLTSESKIALQTNLALQAEAVGASDDTVFFKLDDEFHLLMANATGHRRAAEVLEREKLQLDRLRGLSLRTKGHHAQLYAEHKDIFEAIVAQDEAGATEKAQLHFRTILDVLADLMLRHKEYFD
ncbi:GntR family transcriptional regulator [Cognatishimia activa]|uniref:GntR family transcriptional regulator n=1 Tax=Cognatishimia activa TaxID=1715691 RepID=UPI00222F8E24|nr:GntR family transcriptional regulator [Cognatishimia activa]UZD91385.1 GntR family transcriptional regulator [Cognatishimia activa]